MLAKTLALALLSLSLLPAAEAADVACTDQVSFVRECVTAGDGCSVGLDGNPVATCAPQCAAPACAKPDPCKPVTSCAPDVPVCWNGAPLHDGPQHMSPACWSGAGTEACVEGGERVYAHVLGYGTRVGCV